MGKLPETVLLHKKGINRKSEERKSQFRAETLSGDHRGEKTARQEEVKYNIYVFCLKYKLVELINSLLTNIIKLPFDIPGFAGKVKVDCARERVLGEGRNN